MTVRSICLLILLPLSFLSAISGQQKPVTHPSPVVQPTAKPAAPVATPAAPSPMFLTGKVAISDGSEVPLNVVIEKICGSRRTALGYADRKGNFNVRLNDSSLASLVDASDDSRSNITPAAAGSREQGNTNLLGCAIEARSSGYRSDSIEIGSRRVLDNPDVGTLIMRRMGAAGSGTMVSATLLSAPKNAVKSYERGLDAMHKGDRAGAAKDFEKAVAMHPTFANAWYELGHLQMSEGAPEIARASLEKAVAADAKYVPPYSDLAILAYRQKDWAEAIRITDVGLRLDASGGPELHYYKAAAQFNARSFPEGEKNIREAIKLDSAHTIPKAHQLLSYFLSARGAFGEAAVEMRAYLAGETDREAFERGSKELARMEARADAAPKQQPASATAPNE